MNQYFPIPGAQSNCLASQPVLTPRPWTPEHVLSNIEVPRDRMEDGENGHQQMDTLLRKSTIHNYSEKGGQGQKLHTAYLSV